MLCILFCFISHWGYSQIECSNKLLKEIAEQLPDVQFTKGSSKEYMLPLCQGKPIVVEYNNGIVNHIGVKFFNREVMAKHATPVFYFIERYFLELLLLPTDDEIRTKMRMDRVHIKKGRTDIFAIPDLRKELQEIIAAVSHDFSVYVTCNNNRYKASCMVGEKQLAQIEFPVRYELITGNTKLEAENSIYSSLLMYQSKPYEAPDEADMYVYKDNLFCANEDSYVTEDIVSTSYYEKKDDRFIPVLTSQNMEESVYNLFNTDYDWNVVVEVTQNLYGDKKLAYELPLEKLMDYLFNNGCLVYTGIRSYDKSVIEGVAMAVNMELGYQHMLSFSFDKSLFDEPSLHKVKVKMYSYIPIHNVSSLFNENSKKK